MMRASLKNALAVIAAVAATSCQRDEVQVSQHIEPPRAVAREAGGSLLGRDVPAAAVWPPPTDTVRSSGRVISKIITQGIGTSTPELNKNHVLGIGFATYERSGRVSKHVPLMVQAIDLAPDTWREVLLQMKRGEVRRAWITMPDGTTTIMDFEIRSCSVIRPDGTAVNIDD
jgi:hypothetical protein